jgi:dipeptidyl-peptidase-4
MPIHAHSQQFFVVSALAGALVVVAHPVAQDRLPSMPGYDQFSKMQAAMQGGVVVSGAASAVVWSPDGASFTYGAAGKNYRFDLATMKATETGDASAGGGAGRGARGDGSRQGAPPPAQQSQQSQAPPARSGGMQQEQSEMSATPAAACPPLAAQTVRGRQAYCVMAPDETLKAFYRARNLWVANADGSNERQVTKDGDEKARIKYGTGSWVYGEELSQTTAIWWSPDSTKVGFYRFDESQVKDFYLQMNQTAIQDTLDVEAYPKAGAPNPIADVFVYDIGGAKTTKLDVRDGKPFDNTVVGHYVYNVRWSPDGTELLMNRTNRRQQIMEFIGCQPATAACRVIVREEWLTGWTENRPGLTWLRDQKRFIWESERNGYHNYYLYDLTGKLINPITTLATAEAGAIVKIDEAKGVMFYTARDGDNYMKVQLHRVGLDGTGDVRLTDPRFNHPFASCEAGGGGRRGGGGPGAGAGTPSCAISADDAHIVDVYQTHDQPPATRLLDGAGKIVAELAKSDTSKMDQLGLKKAEQYTYLAADGKTTLYGQIQFPSTFDSAKKYPTLITVYGGPASGSNVPTENFVQPSATPEYGFLTVQLSYRGVPGMGKSMLDALYLKLGVTEMDDMALGIKALWSRPYFDKDRVGMYGTSYGGYTSATMILRHPEVVTVASASSPPTAWYNYDSIYTERYMWIPQENKDGYEAGNDANFAGNLRGRLLLYYGTADNNVHPDNSMQLITALQAARKSFELQVGPDQGHSGVNNSRMMEFFIENLVMHPERIFKS